MAPDTILLEKLQRLQRMLRETPVLELTRAPLRLFAKLEYQNPFGSLKDRAAYWILKRAVERGEVTQESTIVESSSGNFASALAFFCRMIGLRFVPVIDPNITPSYEAFLRRACETVVKVDERDDTGGFLKTRLRKVEELCASIPGAFWTNQYENPDNMDAHYQLTGAELCRAFDRLDYLFLGVSSGGTISGVSNRVRERFPRCRIIAVDVEGSVIFGGPPRKRYIPGIGSSIVPPLVKRAVFDEVVMISEKDTVAACQALLHEHGLFVGGSSGTVYAAILRLARSLESQPPAEPPTVAFLCADRGTAYLETVFNPQWTARL
jgi:N-(2-amino-2-carboxyethyl)-L-glutamate synthase